MRNHYIDALKGFAALNAETFQAWLSRHGASAATLGGAVLKSLHGGIFAYRDGDLAQPGITAVQVHAPYQGSLDAERELIERVRREVDVEVWRAVDMTALNDGEGVAELVDRLVLDSGAGGTGERFDWSRIPTTDALLAGGLTPGNLDEALRTGCLGLDLNSGFEDPRGHKDAAALRRGFATIRNFHF